MTIFGPMDIARSLTRLCRLCVNAAMLINTAKDLHGDADARPHYPDLAAFNHHYAKKICRSHGIDIRQKGGPPGYPAIYAANHLGYIDPFVIVSQTPMLPIAKMETAGWPLIGKAMKSSGVLFVKRGDPHSGASLLRKAVRVLEDGASILNFPEGTTTRGDRVLPFRRGLFGIARLMNIPVVPVCIEYMDPSLAWCGDTLFFPHYLETSAKKRAHVRVCFGEPVSPMTFKDPESLAEHCRMAVMEQLGGRQARAFGDSGSRMHAALAIPDMGR